MLKILKTWKAEEMLQSNSSEMSLINKHCPGPKIHICTTLFQPARTTPRLANSVWLMMTMRTMMIHQLSTVEAQHWKTNRRFRLVIQKVLQSQSLLNAATASWALPHWLFFSNGSWNLALGPFGLLFQIMSRWTAPQREGSWLIWPVQGF